MPASGRGVRRWSASGTWKCVATPNVGKPFGLHYRSKSEGGWGAFGLFSWIYETDVQFPTYTPVSGMRMLTGLLPTGQFVEWTIYDDPVVPPGVGTWECWVDAVEYRGVREYSYAANPEYLGEFQHGNPPELLGWFEVPVGSQFYAKVTLGTKTLELSGVSTEPRTMVPGFGFGITGSTGVELRQPGGPVFSETVFLTGSAMGATFGAPATFHYDNNDPPHDPIGTNTVVDLDFNGGIQAVVSTDATGNASYPDGYFWGGRLDWQIPSEYRIVGDVRAMTDLHAATFQGETNSKTVRGIDALLFDPAEDKTCERRMRTAYFHRAGPFGFSQPIYIDNSGPGFSANLRVASLDAASEVRCTKLLARGERFDGVTITHAERRVLDEADSTANWSGVTLVGGHLQVDTATTPAASRSFAGSPQKATAYRYLVLDVVPPIAGAIITARITANDGVWDFRGKAGAAGVLSSVAFDLCGNSQKPGTVDLKGSRWPVGVSDPTAFAWGVDVIHGVELRFEFGSGVYEIRELRLQRFEPPKITLLNAEGSIAEFSGGPSDLIYLYAVGDVDGRRTIDYWGVRSAGPTPVQSSLEEFKTWVESEYPGYTVTLNAAGAFPLVSLGGAGVILDAVDDPQWWIRREWDQGQPIPYQTFYSGMELPPLSGDILGGAGFGGPAVFRCMKILSGSRNGLVLKGNSKPAPGVTVVGERLPGLESSGTDVTDARGRYELGSPWGRSAVNHRVTEQRGDPEYWKFATVGMPLRLDHRLSFRSEIPGRAPWILQDAKGRFHKAWVDGEGEARYLRSDFTVRSGDWAADAIAEDSGDGYTARMAIDPLTGRIEMLVGLRDGSDACSAWETFSDDGGATWSHPELFMANAVFPSPAAGWDGSRARAWFVFDAGTTGPGTAWGVHRYPGDTDWSTPFQFVDAAGDPIPVAEGGMANVAMARDGQRRWTWSPILHGETEPSDWFSLDACRTWTRLDTP